MLGSATIILKFKDIRLKKEQKNVFSLERSVICKYSYIASDIISKALTYLFTH